ncbi:hypothetical protein KIW84_045179 [Lathyrus oleraceus]|uniref:Thioredoxin domain-containing protein n=1 Tax=Pisum sativum TaxID=3888 RepID=A0A9D4XMG8_PEA|nr:hypothetical protein KIW84_045179 [Pisum sativum]
MQSWGFLAVGSLTEGECGHALFKRVELKFTTSERERLDSGLVDLIESVTWSPKNAKACLETPIVLAKVDVNEEENKDLASKYEVKGLPTFKNTKVS